ncbi:hypothetical protein [Actinomadura sp. DC4]|nr:hypothetical protein [Actinomadura sp. DC4]MDN3358005.1 hypothetical protein [Actinomadura sp. DC4]
MKVQRLRSAGVIGAALVLALTACGGHSHHVVHHHVVHHHVVHHVVRHH